MNTLTIAAIVIGLLVVASVSVMALTSNDNTTAPVKTTQCSSCGNKCTAASNCGSPTCAAAKGTGTCGCGK